MIILIDTMAERYGQLPSEVMRNATTFDVFVADTAIGYRNYLQDKAEGRQATYNPTDYTQDELLKILNESRGKS
jgi:hypothetical protein